MTKTINAKKYLAKQNVARKAYYLSKKSKTPTRAATDKRNQVQE